MIRTQPEYRRQAFEAGLRRVGYTLTDGYGRAQPQSRDDLIVVWNVRRGTDERYAREWESRGGTVVVAENGYLQQVDKTYFSISTHGHNGSGWFPVGNDAPARFDRLGFEIKPMVDTPETDLGARILVRDQRSIGSQLMHSPRGWGQATVAKLKARGFKHVTLMAHPGDKGKLEADAAALARADRVVIWSSAIGVRALVDGIPVRHEAPHWICAGWQADRARSLHRMAAGQYHHEEIAAGEPFARMKAAGWGAGEAKETGAC
ncbi:MAG: hypothetical protein KF863_21515 [Rubrivivax sp.]|nr:hypothetical protein [Rubrivivax sp.]